MCHVLTLSKISLPTVFCVPFRKMCSCLNASEIDFMEKLLIPLRIQENRINCSTGGYLITSTLTEDFFRSAFFSSTAFKCGFTFKLLEVQNERLIGNHC